MFSAEESMRVFKNCVHAFIKSPFLFCFFNCCKLQRGEVLLLCLMSVHLYYSWRVYQSIYPMASYSILINRRFKHLLIFLYIYICMYIYTLFFIVQVQLSPFPHHHSPHPTHPSIPPLILPLFGFVHGSFIHVP